MSAFVVSRECMQRVALTICHRSRYGQVIPTFDGIPTNLPTAPTEIGRRLFTLNIEAVFQRYPDTQDNPDTLPGDIDADGRSVALKEAAAFRTSAALHVNPIAGLKAMQCLSYQCDEGNVPETVLYKEREAAIGRIAVHIVEGLPAYDKAAWGRA